MKWIKCSDQLPPLDIGIIVKDLDNHNNEIFCTLKSIDDIEEGVVDAWTNDIIPCGCEGDECQRDWILFEEWKLYEMDQR